MALVMLAKSWSCAAADERFGVGSAVDVGRRSRGRGVVGEEREERRRGGEGVRGVSESEISSTVIDAVPFRLAVVDFVNLGEDVAVLVRASLFF